MCFQDHGPWKSNLMPRRFQVVAKDVVHVPEKKATDKHFNACRPRPLAATLTRSPKSQLTCHCELLDLANVCFTLDGYTSPKSRLELIVRREEPADGGCQGETAVCELVEDWVFGVEIVHLFKKAGV